MPVKGRDKIKVSLRLWSDNIDLTKISQKLGLGCGHLHIKGMPMATIGVLSNKIATRYYFSSADVALTCGLEVSPFCKKILNAVNGVLDIKRHISEGNIDAIIWIAIIASSSLSKKFLDNYLIESAKDIGIDILQEDYTDDTAEEMPAKKWILKAQNPFERG